MSDAGFAPRSDFLRVLIYEGAEKRGRAMGGSSVINGQIAIRGVPEDFEDWAAAGCAGWGWDDLLPYFCRLETDRDHGRTRGSAVPGRVVSGARR